MERRNERGVLIRRERRDCRTGALLEDEEFTAHGERSILRIRRAYRSDGERQVVVEQEFAVRRNSASRRETRWWELRGEGRVLVRRARYHESGRLQQLDAWRPSATTKLWKISFDGETARMLRVERYDEQGRLASVTRFDESGSLASYRGRDGRILPLDFTLRPKQSRAAANSPLAVAAITQEMAAGPVDLFFLGDSITQLFTAREAPEKLWQARFGRYRAVNAGMAGDRTQNVLWRLAQPDLPLIAPRLTILNIGTNNVSDFTSAERVAEGVVAVLARLRALQPDTPILVMGIFPMDPGRAKDPRPERVAIANAMLAGIADEESIRVLDIGALLRDDEGRVNRRLLPDGIHPSVAGYRIWADAIEPIVRESLGECGPGCCFEASARPVRPDPKPGGP